MLRTSKVTGKMTNIVKSGSSVAFDTETVSSTGKVEKASYVVTCTAKSDVYQVRKFDGMKEKECYLVDTWNAECDCKGWQNGFLCRHIKMVRSLESRKVI